MITYIYSGLRGMKHILKHMRISVLSVIHKKRIIMMSEQESEKLILKYYTPKPLYTRKILLKPFDKNYYNLTIIVPAYNCECYVGKCLDSLIKQVTNYTYEIIVVNDGSKDNTEEVIKGVNSPLIHLINQPNGGAAMARNTGLMNATGEYVCFIDSDDYIETNYIERLLSEAYKHDADIVKCGYYIHPVKLNINSDGIKTLKKPIVFSGDVTYLLTEYDGFVWNMVEKRSLWKDIAFPEKWWFEDMIMKLLVMRKSKKYVYIDEPLYHYVCLETSLSNSGWNSKDIRGIDQLWLVKNIVEHSKEMGVENTASIYPTILNELGKFLFYRTKNLPMELRHAVFVQAAFLTDFFRVNGMDKELNNSSHKKLNKAFSNRDFSLWEIESSI